MTVEARRNAFASMPQILANVASRLPTRTTFDQIPMMYSDDSLDLATPTVCALQDALLDGLTDYTSDERGDVGSWVRIACVKGLTTFAETMFGHARELPNFPEYFPASRYHDAVGGILKQGVERLDNVRQQAGECFLRLLRLQLPQVTHAEEWQIQGAENMKKLFLRYQMILLRPHGL